MTVAPVGESAERADPHGAVRRLQQCSHQVVAESVERGPSDEFAIFELRKAAARADPERALRIKIERAHEVVGQSVG